MISGPTTNLPRTCYLSACLVSRILEEVTRIAHPVNLRLGDGSNQMHFPDVMRCIKIMRPNPTKQGSRTLQIVPAKLFTYQLSCPFFKNKIKTNIIWGYLHISFLSGFCGPCSHHI